MRTRFQKVDVAAEVAKMYQQGMRLRSYATEHVVHVLDNSDKSKMSYREIQLKRKNDQVNQLFMTNKEVELRNKYCEVLAIDKMNVVSAKINGNYFFMNLNINGEEKIIRFNLSYSDKKQDKSELCMDFSIVPSKFRPVSRRERFESAIEKTVEMLSNNLCTLRENSFSNPVFFKDTDCFIN